MTVLLQSKKWNKASRKDERRYLKEMKAYTPPEEVEEPESEEEKEEVKKDLNKFGYEISAPITFNLTRILDECDKN